jgi:hypothetical protein
MRHPGERSPTETLAGELYPIQHSPNKPDGYFAGSFSKRSITVFTSSLSHSMAVFTE